MKVNFFLKLFQVLGILLYGLTMSAQYSDAYLDNNPPEIYPKFWENPNGDIFEEASVYKPDIIGAWTLFEINNEQRNDLFTADVKCIDNIQQRELLIHNKDFRIYPNPATHEITVENLSGNYLLQIFSVEGRLIKSMSKELSGIEQINVANLDKGLYYLNLSNEMENISELIIIQ